MTSVAASGAAGRSGASVAGELRGGLNNAVVALGVLLPLGLLSFAPLGPAGATVGLQAAFASAIFGGLVAALVGGAPIPGSIPRTSTCLIFAGLVAKLAADPNLVGAGGVDIARIVALTSLSVALAGALQVALGLLKLGTLVRYVPLPVLAGFMDGIAVMIAVSQIPPLLGLDGPFAMTGDVLALAIPGSIALGLATWGVAWLVSRGGPRAPAALAGLVFGALAYAAARHLLPDVPLGRLLGSAAGGIPHPDALAPLLDDGFASLLRAHLSQLVATGFVIALIGSMDVLLAAAATDNLCGTRHAPNRFLIGQGLGNLASALFGGVPVAFSTATSLANFRSGGRGTLSGVVAVAALLALLMLGGPVLARIPVAATAGLMLFIGLGLFDRWSRVVWRQFRAGHGDHETLWNLLVVVVVGLVTVFFGFVVAIAVGVLLSMALFIVALNRSLVRSVATGETRASRRIYPPPQAQALRARGREIVLVQLEGAVFFGTAERLAREVEPLGPGAKFVILDFKRVTMIDASGAMALDRLSQELHAQGARLLLAGIVRGDRHARALHAFGAFLAATESRWFDDADQALEFAERHLLEGADGPPRGVELPCTALPLFANLTADEVASVRARVDRIALASGEVLFREGEPGNRVYALAQGSVSIVARGLDGAPDRRFASFSPGVMFGEAAMLDGGGRSASAIADVDSVVYAMTRASLDELRASDPALGGKVLFNLTLELSARLRFASATIQAVDR
jgi:MFS superfamily sulfate permease-like transporter